LIDKVSTKKFHHVFLKKIGSRRYGRNKHNFGIKISNAITQSSKNPLFSPKYPLGYSPCRIYGKSSSGIS
jgi:hypothetical protein